MNIRWYSRFVRIGELDKTEESSLPKVCWNKFVEVLVKSLIHFRDLYCNLCEKLITVWLISDILIEKV